MRMREFDVIIVGGGAVGAAILHFLAKLGITQTLLLEGKSGFAKGASGEWLPLVSQQGNGAIYHYYRNTFCRETGINPDFRETGSLTFKNQLSPRVYDHKAVEFLDAQEGRKRFPQFQWCDADVAIYEPFSGVISPQKTVQGWVESAQRNGAAVRSGCRVSEILKFGDRVEGVLCQNGDIFYCRQLVLAVGAGISTLLTSFGIRVPIETRPVQVNRFSLQGIELNSEISSLSFFDELDGCNGRVMADGTLLAIHSPAHWTPRSSMKEGPRLDDAASSKRVLCRRLKAIKSSSFLEGMRTWVTTLDPDVPDFKKGYINTFENMAIVAGYGTHAFVHLPIAAPLLAKQVAQKLKQKRQFNSIPRVIPWTPAPLL